MRAAQAAIARAARSMPMNIQHIPVYGIDDLAARSDVRGFELLRLESAFVNARRDIVAAHRHDYYEICWVTGGRGALAIDFHEYAIEPPMFGFFAPGQVHAWRLSAPVSGCIMRLSGAFFLEGAHAQLDIAELPWFYAVDTPPVLCVGPAQADVFSGLFQQMAQEYAAPAPDREIVLRAYAQILLVKARRLVQHSSVSHRAMGDYALTKQFLQLVERGYRSSISPADYAAQLHVTASHLNAIVRRTMNRTAGALIRERLLLEAKRLLQFSDLAVAEIADQLNFEDPSYFGRFFKKYTQLSPGAFRQLR